MQVKIEIIRLLYDIFTQEFEKVRGQPFPLHPTTTTFQKDITYRRQIQELIFQKTQIDKYFDPHNLFIYLYQYLKPQLSEQITEASWKVTKKFPNRLFCLADCKNLEEFLDKYQQQLGAAVVEQQRANISRFRSNTDSREIKKAFQCHISDVKGTKTAILAVYHGNLVRLYLNSELTFYNGQLKFSDNFVTIDFVKESQHQRSFSSKKIRDSTFEVSFKLLTDSTFEEQIFIRGSYAAVNDNEYLSAMPPMVSGTVVLEKIDDIHITPSTTFEDLNFLRSTYPPSEIAALITHQRNEIKKLNTKLTRGKSYEVRCKEELELMNEDNIHFKNPSATVGKYLLLIHSDTHSSIRKIPLTIEQNLTIEAKAKRSVEQVEIVNYHGRLTLFNQDLLSFRLQKGVNPIDFMEGIFHFRGKHLPMYGLTCGIFRNAPKAGKAVLIKNSDALSKITNLQKAEFIPLESKLFEKLDQKYALSEFFKGDFLEKENINSKFIISNPHHLYEPLYHKKKQSFDNFAGLYQEYYFDPNKNKIRQDYIQINADGTAWMVGRHRYIGEVESYETKITLIFKPRGVGAIFPVTYTLHVEDNVFLSGIYTSVNEDNVRISSNRSLLIRKKAGLTNQEEFFKLNRSYIELYSPEYEQFNQQYDNIGKKLRGVIGNHLETDLRDEQSTQLFGEVFFGNACYYASKAKGFDPMALRALEELKKAFLHGFDDRELLAAEMAEEGMLADLAPTIDIENLSIKQG